MAEPSPLASPAAPAGTRERKRLETRRRIAEAGQQLFLARGYQSTTLDDIAAAAGISRRTFFAHFKSKDEIIWFWQQAGTAQLHARLRMVSPDVPPLQAVRDALVHHISRYTTEEMIAIDTLMLSSEVLQARKQAHYAEQEQALYAVLCEVWRQPERRLGLRMVAVLGGGAMRTALQAWREQPGPRRPVAEFLLDAFKAAQTELLSGG